MKKIHPLILLSAAVTLPAQIQAAVLSAPTITSAAPAFSGSFVAANAFDQNDPEYATANAGTGTFMEMDFGSEVVIDRVVASTRNSGAASDRFSQITYTFSDDAVFDAGDRSVTINANSAQGQSGVYSVGRQQARYVRWDVDALASGGTTGNTGVQEMFFLKAPGASTLIKTATAYNSATPFNASFTTANASNGILGRSGGGIEYASASLGTGTFIDFDMGFFAAINGFEYFDRFATVDRTGTYDLLFSDDPNFGTIKQTFSYSKGTSLVDSGSFPTVFARYVRLDVTGLGSTGTNLGASELLFYKQGASLPEPSTMGFLFTGLTVLGAIRRKRRCLVN